MAKNQTSWTENEINRFVDEYIVQRKRGLTKGQARLNAQRILPEGIRYSETTIMRGMLPLEIKKRTDAAEAEGRTIDTVKPEVFAAPVVEQSGELNSTELFAKAFEKLREEIREEANGRLNKILELLTAPDQLRDQTLFDLISDTRPKVIRRRIVIVGLLDSQNRFISEKFGQEFKIKFFTANEGSSKALKASCQSADYVLSMIDFVSHDVERVATVSMANTDGHLVQVSGGMSSLIKKLESIRLKA